MTGCLVLGGADGIFPSNYVELQCGPVQSRKPAYGAAIRLRTWQAPYALHATQRCARNRTVQLGADPPFDRARQPPAPEQLVPMKRTAV